MEEDNYSNSMLRWRNRRRMAYISLIAILVITFLCLFIVPLDRISANEMIISTVIFVLGSVVGAYLGFATMDDKWNTPSKGGK